MNAFRPGLLRKTPTTPTKINAAHLRLHQARWRLLLRAHTDATTHGQALPNTSASAAHPGAKAHPQAHPLRHFFAVTALTVSASVSFVLGALYPPDLAVLLSPRPSPPPPDPSSPQSLSLVTSIESQMHALPFLKRLRAESNADQWYETKPYLHYPEERKVNSLTAGALRGAGRLGVGPLIRAKMDESESWVIVHVGRGLCGHDGIVHGGLLATLLDECMGRTAIMNLPEKVGVTATLSIDYKAPCRADQFLAIHTRLTSHVGRKAYVEAQIEDMSGHLIAEGRALFVQPKYAQFLHSAMIRKAVGEKPHDADAEAEKRGEKTEGYSAVLGDIGEKHSGNWET